MEHESVVASSANAAVKVRSGCFFDPSSSLSIRALHSSILDPSCAPPSRERRTRRGSSLEKRSHDRYAIQLDIVLVQGETRHAGTTRDLSLGGTFVHTVAPLRFATEVTLQLTIASLKYEGEMPAVVRWNSPGGVGLAFRSLRARDVHAFNQLFRSARPLAL